MGQSYPPSQNWRPNALSNNPVNSLYFSNQPELNLSTTKVGTLSFTTRGPAGTGMYIEWGDGSASEWIAHLGVSTDVVTNHNYIGAGSKPVKFTGRLDLVTYFLCIDSTLSGDIAGLATLTSLTTLSLYNTSVSGNITGLATLTSLVTLYLYNTSVSGDIVGLATLTSLTTLGLYNTSVSGNISVLATLTSLTNLYLYNIAISGDIAILATLTSLVNIYLSNTSVSGNISGLATLTSLVTLYLHNTAISGDIAVLATLTSLVNLSLYNDSLDYNTTTLPQWNNNSIQIQSTTLTSTEVDNFLIDLAAAGGTNGTLNIAGTNAARTSASDAAKATLLANGWALTVNE